MVSEARRRRQEFFERWALGNFALSRLAAVAAGIKVLVEECADVEFVEGIGFRLLWNFFGFVLGKFSSA
jgi:hypothetical protein